MKISAIENFFNSQESQEESSSQFQEDTFTQFQGDNSLQFQEDTSTVFQGDNSTEYQESRGEWVTTNYEFPWKFVIIVSVILILFIIIIIVSKILMVKRAVDTISSFDL